MMVIVVLVARRTFAPLYNRNSYVAPMAAPTVALHVRVVTPAPTSVALRKVLLAKVPSGAPVAASPSQSPAPPRPLVSVTVTSSFGAGDIVVGDSPTPPTVNATPLEVPPPGAGVITVIVCAPATVKSVEGNVTV